MSVARVTALMCLAQLVGMLSNASFPALIPTFVAEWGLSGGTAGWIAGMSYAGYVAAVPLLAASTDRLDARAIYLASQLVGVAATAGFALFAMGPGSASALRFADGIALAGTYMVGARMLSDPAVQKRCQRPALPDAGPSRLLDGHRARCHSRGQPQANRHGRRGTRAMRNSIVTLLYTRRYGQYVGEDEFGNRYYRNPNAHRAPGLLSSSEKRWVVYNGDPEASRVPPDWHAWLHHTTDEPPTRGGVPEKQPWEKAHRPNRTMTAEAYRPPGHTLRGGKRARGTGDYEPWMPS